MSRSLESAELTGDPKHRPFLDDPGDARAGAGRATRRPSEPFGGLYITLGVSPPYRARPLLTHRPAPVPPAKAMRWRRRSWEVINSDIVAGRTPGPEAPAEWLPHLRRLMEASRSPVQGPTWWTPLRAYDGNVETRTDPSSYYRDGMRRLGPSRPATRGAAADAGGLGTLRGLSKAAGADRAGDGVHRRHPVAPPLLPSGGVAGVDVRLGPHLDPAHRSALRQAGQR